jgi:hypothetical protein
MRESSGDDFFNNAMLSLASWELGTVGPDAMQTGSGLGGVSGLGRLDADAFGQPQTPSFQD